MLHAWSVLFPVVSVLFHYLVVCIHQLWNTASLSAYYLQYNFETWLCLPSLQSFILWPLNSTSLLRLCSFRQLQRRRHHSPVLALLISSHWTQMTSTTSVWTPGGNRLGCCSEHTPFTDLTSLRWPDVLDLRGPDVKKSMSHSALKWTAEQPEPNLRLKSTSGRSR